MADFSLDFTIFHSPGACGISFRCFDTPNSITVYQTGRPVEDVEDLLISLRRQCLEFHRLWSFSLEGSDVHLLNQDNLEVDVHWRTADLLRKMQAFHGVEPLLDFTVGPVSYLWKKPEMVPSQVMISQALALVGADRVCITGQSVRKAHEGMRIDVGSAAKGYVADCLASRIREAGISSADIDLGGNLFMLGSHPEGRPWRVSVHIPEGIDAEPLVLQVEDQSVVTSGSYERFSVIDGVRYQHIVNPLTGYPSESDLVSATVAASSSLEADMLATTLLLAGSEGFPEFSQRHPGCQLVAITHDGRVLSSGKE